MKDRSMQQYFTQIKNLVDNIVAAGSKIDNEDIILYTLNGLPTIYNPFKAAIRTSLTPISLENLYSLLCSEEINLQQDHSKELSSPFDNSALLSVLNKPNRGRFTRSQYKNQNARPNSSNEARPQQNQSSVPRPVCQICGKTGHITIDFWHRCNLQYASSSSTNPRAHYTQQQASPNNTEWNLDSGATSHMTRDLSNLSNASSYNGLDSVSMANGNTIPIQHTGNRLLPLPETAHKLSLQNILHVPSISHNLVSISKLPQTTTFQLFLC
ncbi:Retrovirus-related Pol polyprotein from transposon TNT 1-94 [Dendrobium catenatum]|uniref:Retrovirus-related Pol polyprotein from transposon TNT 1-94 n=1 Tax=Dendrobium catenatum TaxID=906689 RepID=A0A2I0XEH6_9ASPA|nr:Retrovirus-related Pol polyprotein from transposon TNT 1-94 [Dendrobium catenatum]